eukprot:15072583-Ditylum_brightwellii.AAC.1
MVLTSLIEEAESIQVVSAGKMAKYLCMVLNKLGLYQDGSTMIYKDNTVAIMMANASKPIGRTRHIDISHFVIQE